MSAVRPTLFACNHSSYLDIMVLRGLIPGCFVSKAEVADWPLFGLLARLQRTVFIDRRAGRAARHRHALQARLDAGANLNRQEARRVRKACVSTCQARWSP